MKFGFDIHGVLDTHPQVYAAMTQALVAAGHEVHIVTGKIKDEEEVDMLLKLGISWTHWFSVAQYHIDLGTHKVWFKKGKPWMDADVWNRTKADYCHEQNIMWLVDDSPVYGKHFDQKTVYALQRDPARADAWDALER